MTTFFTGLNRLLPFVSSALLFMSGIFAFLAPIPLVAVRMKRGALFGLLAFLTNTTLLYFSGGHLSLLLYVVMVGAVGMLMPVFLFQKWSLNRVAGFTLLAMLIASVGMWTAFQSMGEGGLVAWFKAELDQWTTVMKEVATPETREALFGSGDAASFQKNLVRELPGALIISALLMIWANLSMILRLNLGGVRTKLKLDLNFFQIWKAPEFLVWPAIVSGAILIWADTPQLAAYPLGVAGAQTVFRVLMAVYTLQGLSVVSFWMDRFKILGLPRVLIFTLLLVFVLPLITAIGFFDLWFDFRRKLRQSSGSSR